MNKRCINYTPAERERMKAESAKLYANGHSYAEIAKRLDVNSSTVRRWLSPSEAYKVYNKNRVALAKAKNPAYRRRCNQRGTQYKNERRKIDPHFRIAAYLRNRINKAVAAGWKAGSAVRDLGCSIADFKAYLESLFLPGMTWDNQGKWEIDHVRPLASFDLTNREQFLQACHYTNLQPLWATDNNAKGASSWETGRRSQRRA